MTRLLEMQARMDVALFGLGSPFSEVPSRVYAGGYLEDEDYTAISAAGVVGDVATVFFRVDGSTDEIPLNERGTGPDLVVLRRAPAHLPRVRTLQAGQPVRRPRPGRIVIRQRFPRGTGFIFLGESFHTRRVSPFRSAFRHSGQSHRLNRGTCDLE